MAMLDKEVMGEHPEAEAKLEKMTERLAVVEVGFGVPSGDGGGEDGGGKGIRQQVLSSNWTDSLAYI